jgi:hypothetical protein
MEHRYKVKLPALDKEIGFSADNNSADELLTMLFAHFAGEVVIIERKTLIFVGTSGTDESYSSLENLLLV